MKYKCKTNNKSFFFKLFLVLYTHFFWRVQNIYVEYYNFHFKMVILCITKFVTWKIVCENLHEYMQIRQYPIYLNIIFLNSALLLKTKTFRSCNFFRTGSCYWIKIDSVRKKRTVIYHNSVFVLRPQISNWNHYVSEKINHVNFLHKFTNSTTVVALATCVVLPVNGEFIWGKNPLKHA